MIAKSLSMSCECTDTENQENKKEKVSGGFKILLIASCYFSVIHIREFPF